MHFIYRNWRHILGVFVVGVVFLLVCVFVLARKETPEKIIYGMSFNTLYALELSLNPREVYDAFLDELGVRYLRLAAQWSLVSPREGMYDFTELDYQVRRAEEVGAHVVFGVGRRLPRWPECHVPAWAKELSWNEQKVAIRDYIEKVVKRYKDSPAIEYWQVENEPYLEVFAHQYCGDLDEDFLEEEIALVRSLDSSREILVTDSGNLGSWFGAYKNGDVFGTSMYIHFWNPELGQFRTVLPPIAYRVKEGLIRLMYGKKETFLIELSAEPWLLEPITDVSIDVQYSRMDLAKFEDILEYAALSRYERQYLWGGEWWYWLRERGYDDMWERGSQLFAIQ